MIGLDANVLVRLQIGDDPALAAAARTAVDSLTRRAPGVITQITLVEFYWVLRRAYRISHDDVLRAMRAMVSAENVVVEDAVGVRQALDAATDGADFADALIDRAARRAGCTKVLTFDQGASGALGWELLAND